MESYWVLPGRFLAGEYPGDPDEEQACERLDALLGAGVDTFFDLRQPVEGSSYLPVLQRRASRHGLQISYERFPILDHGLPGHAEMGALLDSMDAALAHGRKIYVHCWGGIGRTGTTVGCFLVRHGRSGQQALDQIAEWWQAVPKHKYNPLSPETLEQMQFVLNWHENRPAGTE
jgi:hypothetical protein